MPPLAVNTLPTTDNGIEVSSNPADIQSSTQLVHGCEQCLNHDSARRAEIRSLSRSLHRIKRRLFLAHALGDNPTTGGQTEARRDSAIRTL
mmetsp:Transcript_27560/g.35904  ORF Transcript_27560/g.35904 Transcript_27560/m.35904 type:complete len:91 (+) Transcript_27560:114-386(+)